MAQGASVRHFKLPGALPTMCSDSDARARAGYEAALSVDPDLIIFAPAATAQQKAVEALKCRWAGEIFADRAYNDDATLGDRALPGAVIHDPELAARRMVEMVQAGAIVTESGARIPAPVDTICLHGDGATALQIARAVRAALEAAGVTLAPFAGRRGAAG